MRRNNSENDLHALARQAMLERGFAPEFGPEIDAALERLSPAVADDGRASVRDLRHLPWFSIDNDDSRDLDQLSVSERVDGGVKLLVAVADVDSRVKNGSAVDAHARQNTTSIYTSGGTFPMLPEPLCFDL